MAKNTQIPKDNNIIKVPIEEAMPDNYLPYAVEVAKERALPDVRDGLKPVQRRILYGAYMLKAFPDKPYYKSARIVGDILGKYHPHGDSSVYEAMVILAQDFTTRKTLIDGHGNWGSQDGDSAAAMRYTEARLTNIAFEMMTDIDKDVVDMQENYSGSELEPTVLPAKYPNLLVNGAFGIAVGLATNIPPHNLNEVIDATLACIDKKDITTKELMKYIKGPDLPTGGIIIGKESLLSAYETGEGRVTLRAKTSIEKLENGKLGIVITEFPYRKNKAKMLEFISEMTGDKRHAKALESIVDIRDESDRNGVRGVIEFKKSTDIETVEKVLKYLFMKTELQCNISFNMVALANGKPETMGLKTILTHYINHQKDIIKRRTKKELEIAKRRFHIVEGFIRAVDIMDDIISTIRSSKSKKDAEKNLMNLYDFTEIQAEAIVELMLYRLTGLEVETFEKEYKEIEKEIKMLTNILENEKELFKVMRKELIEVKKKFGDDRLTEIVEDDTEAKIDIEEILVVEDNIITMSKDGYIKRISQKSYARSNANIEDIEYREGDYNRFLIQSNTIDTIMFFTDEGNMYQTKCINLPEMKWKEKGEKLDILIKSLNLSAEKIVAAFSISNIAAQMDYLFCTNNGNIKRTSIDKFDSNHAKLVALKLRTEEKLVDVELISREREEGFISINTLNGLSFALEEPILKNIDRNVIGTQLFNLPKSDEVISVEYTNQYDFKEFIITIDSNGTLKVVNKLTASEKKLSNCSTNSSEKLLIFADNGKAYYIPAFMVQNIGESGIKFDKLIDDFDLDKHKILNVLSTKSFEEDKSIYFFTKNGLVKRTHLKEFEGDYSENIAYKFKTIDDYLIKIEINDNKNSKDIIIITKKGMCIRFDSFSVNYVGRVASGVTGITLIEEDEVIYANLIISSLNEDNTELAVDGEKIKSVELTSKASGKKTVEFKDIKIQNRAGKGKNIMLIVLNDYIKNVKIK